MKLIVYTCELKKKNMVRPWEEKQLVTALASVHVIYS